MHEGISTRYESPSDLVGSRLRPSGAAPVARAVAAAVIAVTALLTAAGVGPAGAGEDPPAAPTAQHVQGK
ncbi:hypothetical protein [Streptomyces griseus]|uniref:hypothetical protein n=1 Tax=Streptomyces griseus TaxID=1911 RepID=UPI00056632F9|nr:hypothetical protein [Streptomyces griseus]